MPGYVIDHVNPLECRGQMLRGICSGIRWRRGRPGPGGEEQQVVYHGIYHGIRSQDYAIATTES